MPDKGVGVRVPPPTPVKSESLNSILAGATLVKFDSLKITNLRAIRRFEINNLGSFVVVAGQNGSGKSCVFDAIRLLKSVYGGYSANEYHQWFGEF